MTFINLTFNPPGPIARANESGDVGVSRLDGEVNRPVFASAML